MEVRLGHGVDQIDDDGVIVGGERIASRTVIWTAGVAPSPAGKWLNAETDRAGRVHIQPDLTVPGHPEIFVIGDTATLSQDGKPLGGVAQVAMQQGRYAGRLIERRVTGKPEPPPFRYFDKGTMAVVGQGYAVLQTGKLHLKGLIAWLAWAGVHIMFLAQPGLRFSVFLQWMWTVSYTHLMANTKSIRNVAIVGTGVIGASWAALYLARGLNVVATDPGPNAEANLRRYIDAAWKDLTALGISPNGSRDHLRFTLDMKEACLLYTSRCV